MLPREPLLVTLVKLVDRIPMSTPPAKRGRGRPKVYPDRLIVKALVIMLIRRLYSAYSLLAFLNQDTDLTQALRAELTDNQGRFPSRRTWERRLQTLPDTLPGLVGCLGRHLVKVLHPWATSGRAVAMDSTALRAKGGVWHKKHRKQGIVPHSSIDTEAHWSKSGHHGWWYGWKLHLATTVAALWIPLSAELTPANVHDNTIAARHINRLPFDARFVMGDSHFNAPDLQTRCWQTNRILVAASGRDKPGVEVRRILHKLRHQAIEPFNGLLKNVFEWDGQVPVKGLRRTQLIVLGALIVYQLVLLYQFEHQLPLGRDIKALLRAA
ncbi:MAG: transposase [Chloroflexota bacterium]|nr:transposase [Chloroflexota bacterium]